MHVDDKVATDPILVAESRPKDKMWTHHHRGIKSDHHLTNCIKKGQLVLATAAKAGHM